LAKLPNLVIFLMHTFQRNFFVIATSSQPDKGVIYVTGTFDCEYEKVVRLPIKMCDLRGENRSDRQCGIRFLDVTIVDKDDNQPQDGNQFISVFNYKGGLHFTQSYEEVHVVLVKI